MLVPERVDGFGGVTREQVVRRHRRRGLISAKQVERHVLVKAARLVPGRGVGIELIVQQPGPRKIAGAAVRRCVPGAHLDELVEEPDGPDDHSPELRAVEHSAGSRVDTERPGRMSGVPGAHVPRERVSGSYGGLEIPSVAGQLVEKEVTEAEQSDLVGLDSAVETTWKSGQATAVGPLARAGRCKRNS